MAQLTLLQAINNALDVQLTNDKSVVVFGEDAGFEGGVFRVTAGLQKKHGVDRVFDTPIAEAAIVGSSLGMAIGGLKPVVELQFSGFMFPGYNQIVVHLARFRNRTRGNYTAGVVIRMPYGGGVRALEHHSEALETLFAHIPGLKLVVPSTPYDAKGLLTAAIKDPDPVIFFEPKKYYRAGKQEVPEDEYIVEIGKANVIQEGSDLTVVSWGAALRDVQKALPNLGQDMSIELIDLRTIAPMDSKTVVESVKKTGRLLVVSEQVRTLSIATELITRVNEEAFLYLEAPPMRVGGYDITIPLPKGEFHQALNEKKILNAINALATYEV